MKSFIFSLLDFFLIPVTWFYATFFKTMRKRNFRSFSFSKRILFSVGVFPIRDHYYEPLFNPKNLRLSLRKNRNLPGIDFNVDEQLSLLKKFDYRSELISFPIENSNNKLEYCYNKGPFNSGDAEMLYSMIRHFKPKRIIEIGSGYSTLMTENAIKQNNTENSDYYCEHICIEPFENDWLEQLNIKVVREMVETTDLSIYKTLEANDILFIDSTHMIRPQGDVLFEYLEILPTLKPGVVVHIHDIFSPKDYLDEWINEPRFWNEQYLLEAFLSNNNDFRIIGANNYLMHNYYNEFSEACPVLEQQKEKGEIREPGSFWIVRN